MATTLTYQCPNCSAGLKFDPEKGKLCCEFCQSEFTEEELAATETARAAEEAASRAAEEAAEAMEHPDEEYSALLCSYSCSSCGAEVVADQNTAVTFCPYCHNPILLGGRLAGQMKPHKVIPFAFDKKEAEKRFLAFAKKKWFVPRGFTAPDQVEKMTGIYYPFWVTDADTDASMTARATRKRSWRAGDYLYTETSNFHIERRGDIHFEDIVTPALKEEDREMLNGILPYPSDSLQPFTMPCLSGFIAKKRDIEIEAVRNAVKNRMMDYSGQLLRGTIHGYTTVLPGTPRLLVKEMHWDYTLMPIYLLNYRYKNKTYTYALNGYTGKVYGKLPLSLGKLFLFGGIIGAVAAVIAALICFL